MSPLCIADLCVSSGDHSSSQTNKEKSRPLPPPPRFPFIPRQTTMAIHATPPSSPTTPPTPPPNRSPFFIRTLIPSLASPLTLTCPFLPPSSQLITATATALTISTVDPRTASLTPLCVHPLPAAPRALAFLPSPTPAILLVLSASAQLSFFRFDAHRSRLQLVGTTALHPASPPAAPDAHLVAIHPTKRLIAHALLSSHLSFLPLLFLAEGVSVGKAIHHRVPGVVLAIDFLEDDGHTAAFVALIQRHDGQQIDLFTVTYEPSATISVTRAPSMQNCASFLPSRRFAPALPRRAASISRIPHRPYMFAIHLTGHVVVADARPIVDSGLHTAKHAHSSSTITFTKAPLPPSPAYLPPSSRRPSASAPPTAAAAAVAAMADHTMSGWHYADGWRPARSGPPATPRPRPPGMPPSTDLAQLANSFLVAPPHLILPFGVSNGLACACVDAGAHFRGIVDREDGAAVYFATQSGALFALRAGEGHQLGVTSAVIPDMPPPGPGYDPSRHTYYVEYIGDVGPAFALAALDDRLLFVANDGADGSLRRLHVPAVDEAARMAHGQHQADALAPGDLASAQPRRYGLEVRQEFLNLAPISDFVIVPPVKRRATQGKSRYRKGDRSAGAGLEFAVEDRDVDMEDEVAPLRLDLTADPERVERERALREQADQTSAYAYTLYGGPHESEMITCSGLGKHGSIRMIRPGAPVTIFASSGNTFPACNDIWPIRFTKDAKHDAGLLLTFAASTGILYSVPTSISEQMQQPDGLPAVAKLVSGAHATSARSDVRTIAVGALEDGILAQVHENGIRVMYMKTIDEVPLQLQSAVVNGELTDSICKRAMDWEPPDDGVISVGAIGEGFALVCVVRKGLQRPLLCLLKLYPGDFSKGVFVVASEVLEHELSCIEIPEWTNTTARHEFTCMPNLPPIAFLGTYIPSIEVRLLTSNLETVDRKAMYPWTLQGESGSDSVDGLRSEFEELSSPARSVDEVRGNSRNSGGSPQPGPSRSTAVPESFCSLEMDGKKLIFVGLRDGSAMCLSFTPRDSSQHMAIGSPFWWRLTVDSHRKLGHRPVVVRSFTAAVGPVVIGQTERPWACTSFGVGRLKWIPLAFPESQAVCGYSVPGAERCFAMVGDDDALHICGLRRRSEVSVRSIHVGATPRRIVALSRPENSVLVAATRPTLEGEDPSGLRTEYLGEETPLDRDIYCELRIYNTRLRVQTGCLTLLPNEQVHLMFNWLKYVIIGTSFEIQAEKGSSVGKLCEAGRLLLCTVDTKKKGDAGSSSAATGAAKLVVCSEIVLPGAVLSGAGHAHARTFLVSCNDEVIVFGVCKSKKVLLELGRSTLRSLVVSISICEDVICVVDRHDSVGFFWFDCETGKLVRDRCDHRRRIVSDAVMVDRKLAVGVDRRGGIFSVGYDDGDGPEDGGTDWHDVVNLINERVATLAAEARMNGTGPAGEVLNQAQASSSTLAGRSDSDGSSSESSGDVGVDAAEDVVGGEESGMNVDDVGSDSETETNSTGTGTGTETTTGETGTNTEAGAGGGEAGEMVQANEPGGATGIGHGERDAKIALQVPRNLVCHHSFNMRCTSVRVRAGAFSRRETMRELEERQDSRRGRRADSERGGGWAGCEGEQVGSDARAAVFCGTLDGAVVAAAPMSHAAYALLARVESAMGAHASFADFGLGVGFAARRGWRADVYDARKKGCIDGDLLDNFAALPRDARLEIATRAGCPGNRGALRIEAAIRDMFDRVG